jgi:hypothetical protein
LNEFLVSLIGVVELSLLEVINLVVLDELSGESLASE